MVANFAEEATNKAGLRMGVAAAYLFLMVYSIGIDVAGVVFYSELCKSPSQQLLLPSNRCLHLLLLCTC